MVVFLFLSFSLRFAGTYFTACAFLCSHMLNVSQLVRNCTAWANKSLGYHMWQPFSTLNKLNRMHSYTARGVRKARVCTSFLPSISAFRRSAENRPDLFLFGCLAFWTDFQRLLTFVNLYYNAQPTLLVVFSDHISVVLSIKVHESFFQELRHNSRKS